MTVSVRIEPGDPLTGHLLYRATEYSFAFTVSDSLEVRQRAGSEGVTSLVADSLQLEVGVETGQLLFAWGYLPEGSWLAAALRQPRLVPGVVKVEDLDELESGVSLSISRGADWVVEFDRSLGWLRVSSSADVREVIVQIADGVAVGVLRGFIVEIWLRPEFVE
jgi:hypothetical protein